MANDLLNVMQLISSLEVGGSEKLLVDLLAASRDDDQVNFTVVIMNQSVSDAMRERIERLGINVYYLNRPEGHQHPKYLLELLQIIRRHHIQIIHAHNFGSKLWAVLCKLTCPWLRLVFTIHDTMMMPRLDWKQILIHRHVIDINIAISKTVAALCEQRQVKNYRQIYNGIHLNQFANPNKPTMTQRLAKASFAERPLQVVHVGRMDYRVKGQDILIQAIHRCKERGLNVQCRLMGGVYAYNEQAYNELQALVKELGLEQQVEFLVNRTDVPAVLSEADIFVLPSRFEGLGLVVLEAMAAGLPVIASNTDGPQELVEHGVTGLLFETENAEQLSERIADYYTNPAQADRVRQTALQHVQQFDIHAMKRGYYQLYESIVPHCLESHARNQRAQAHNPSGRLPHEATV